MDSDNPSDNATIPNSRRRQLLAGIGASAGAAAFGIGRTAASSHDVTVTLDNEGASAWRATDVEGSDDVAETGTDNPTLSLTEGVRYQFVNNGWSAHPLEFQDGNGGALLSQNREGSYESNADVNWVDNETEIAFTVTGDLAAELGAYICTTHSRSMVGSVETVAQQQQGTASVSISDQSTDGTTVVVDSVTVEDGGFIAIHDSSLNDGEVLASVIGASDYLEPGSYENLTVELSDPITEADTLIPMAHRDTNGNEEYDFVTSEAGADGPYTADGGPVTDAATVEIEQPAAVQITAQQSRGDGVTVDFARLDDGGFVTIHDSSLLDGEALESVIGTSDYLEPGSYTDVLVEFDEPIEADDTLIPMAHRDTNGNQEYDFVDSGASADGPYTNNDGAITDNAEVTVQQPEAAISFQNQATASSTFTASSQTTPGVRVSGVSSNVESAVVVTYQGTGGAYSDGDLVIAGLDTFGADALDDTRATVPVEEAGGFPGNHTAHVIPVADLSSEYAPGDTVSAETADAIVANDTATVLQGTITFDDQTVEGPIEPGDALATVDASLTGGDQAFTVDVHVTNDNNELVGAEWAGSSNVLSGENEGVDILAERVPEDGEFNEFPIEGQDSYVAMIHFVNDDTTAGTEASPGSFPVLPNVNGGEGTAPGGVTTQAQVTAQVDDDGGDTAAGDGDGGDGGDSDGGGPGFGIGGAVAALGGLGYAIRRRLDDDNGAE
jgi:hypothetical protein